jgi:hypothetical protein
MTAAQQRDSAADRQDEQERLEGMHRRLPDLIRTMPDEDFMHRLGVVIEKVYVLDRQATSKEGMLGVVGVMLNGIAILAHLFDGKTGEGFGANAMVFLEGDEAKPWWPHTLFCGTGVALEGLRGLLVLPHELAASVDNMRDTSIKEIALPVPKDPGMGKTSGGTGWMVLPGAPFVFSVSTRFELFATSAAEVDEWCQKEGDHTNNVRDQLREYFKNMPFTGFLSMPLYAPTEAYEEKRTPMGVLNIHWSKATRIKNREATSLFVHGLSPLRMLLASRLTELRKAHGPPIPAAAPEPALRSR